MAITAAAFVVQAGSTGAAPAGQPVERERVPTASVAPPSAQDDATTSAAPSAQVAAASNLTYNTTDPCRAVDTRELFDHPFGPGQPFDLLRVPLAGACGIPDDDTVKAVMVNIIVVDTGGTGYVRYAPYPITSNPDVTVVNFNRGLVNSNAVAVSICGSTCDADIDLWVRGASTHIVIDVLGYFTQTAA